MMVHELDDEATLEEEELLADRDEDFSDELEDLQKVTDAFSDVVMELSWLQFLI